MMRPTLTTVLRPPISHEVRLSRRTLLRVGATSAGGFALTVALPSWSEAGNEAGLDLNAFVRIAGRPCAPDDAKRRDGTGNLYVPIHASGGGTRRRSRRGCNRTCSAERCPLRQSKPTPASTNDRRLLINSRLRIDETPRIETHIVPSTLDPGLGEAATAVVTPAITNAIFAASGRRIRRLPIQPA